MRAMILAAGRGERMGCLTAHTPKPLLKVDGRYLISHVIAQLKKAGIQDIIVNISYLGDQIQQALGNGDSEGVSIEYSVEEERLETGGGIVKALSLLGDAPFVVLSADVLTDYPLSQLPKEPEGLAHLVMVPNPPYHPGGDFALHEGRVQLEGADQLTFGNVSVLRKELFAGCSIQSFPLSTVLRPAISTHQVSGEIYRGFWFNVGTPDELDRANQAIHFPA